MNKTNIGSLAISNRFAKYAVAAGATLASAAVTHADIITWDLSGLSDDSRTLTGEDRRYLDINATSVEEVISGSFSYRTDFELHTYKGWNSGTKESSYNVSLDRMGKQQWWKLWRAWRGRHARFVYAEPGTVFCVLHFN